MAENFCSEHQSVWFKKGKMRGFAHPIKDESGNDTGQWCNRPESETPPELPPPVEVKTQPVPDNVYQKDDKMSKEEWAEKSKIERESIQKQVALKCACELGAAGVITPDKTLAYAEVYARFLLGDVNVTDETVFKALMGKYFEVS